MIIYAVAKLFDVVEYLILGYVILTWFVRDENHPVMRLLGLFVDPIFIPVRALQDRLGFRTGMLDFTPLFAILALRMVRFAVLKLLFHFVI
ncbi:MAG: YggT family protein [Bacillota bacterium]|nr:YggT family protein [Bacillota bacterium]